jgi:tetratricopeptide (TPR) repeat protein
MAKTAIVKPLGLVLQKAGLVSPEQVQIALQARTNLPHHRFGEILAEKGWIKPQTADFFAEQWPKLVARSEVKPLGQYLKAAGLIDEIEIVTIIREQKTTGLKFGTSAVVKGIISQTTLDFFLEQLALIDREQYERSPEREAANLVNIANYLLHNQNCKPSLLLELYAQILHYKTVLSTNSPEEIELIKSGLIVRCDRKLEIARPIYKTNFDRHWVEQELARLQPYGKIRLKLFGLETRASLPYRVLIEVRRWTNNQPFLTQKIYQILQQQASFISQGKEAEIIQESIEQHIINNWQTNAAAEHLSGLQESLLHNDRCDSISLLKTYKKIWQQREVSPSHSIEEACLLDLGLIDRQLGQLSIANRIYENVFNLGWLDRQLSILTNSMKFSPVNEQLEATALENPPLSRHQISGKILPFLLAIGVVVLGSSVANKIAAIQELHQADRLLQSKNFSQALDSYDSLLEKNLDLDRLWINRGYALAGLKRYEEMLQSCTSATLIHPQSGLAWNCRGEAFYRLQRYRDAIYAFDRSTNLNAEEAVFWLNKSEASYQLEHYRDAALASTKAIELLKIKRSQQKALPNNGSNLPIAYNLQGKSLLKQERYDEALVAYQRALVYSPNYLSAQQGMGIALEKLGKHQEAEAVFHNILERRDLSEAQQAITWLYRGINFCSARQVSDARLAFEQVIELKADPAITEIADSGCGLR